MADRDICKKVNLQSLIYSEDDDIYNIIQSLQVFKDYRQRDDIECILRIIRKEIINTNKEGKIEVNTSIEKKGDRINVINVCGKEKDVNKLYHIVFSALRKINKNLHEEIIKTTKRFIYIEDDGQCAHVYVIVSDFLRSYCCHLN